MAPRTAILGYARTPFGRLLGGLSSLPGTELGGIAIAAALARASVEAGDVDHVVMGHVLQAGTGQITALQAALAAGLPVGVTAETLNKVCASSHRAVTLASTMIAAGEHRVVVAGGMESMSRTPYVLQGMRGGVKMGNGELVDAMIHDGLTDPFTHVHMIVNAAEVADELELSRERQDEWALRSHQRAVGSAEVLAQEIAPVTIAGRKGDTVITTDESPRADTTLEALARLRPVMKKDGSITAGNAPGVNDGAAAIVLAADDWAAEQGIEVRGYIGGHAYVADRSPYLARTPGLAIQALLDKTGLAIDDIARIEINEAFASVALHSADMVGADPERVNVHGGAIAMGHPIGASGARIIGTLVNELRRTGGGLGIAAICSGGGQGDAVLVEVPA